MVLLKLKIPLGSPCLDNPAADKYFLSILGIGTMY
jgi:hypothetical protein